VSSYSKLITKKGKGIHMERSEEQDKNLITKIRKVKFSVGLSKKTTRGWEKAEIGYEAKVNEGNTADAVESFIMERANEKLEEHFAKREKPQRREVKNITERARELINDPNFYVDIEGITWHDSQGQSGPFERSVDRNNPAFQKIVNALMESRAGVISGWYVWLFKDNETLGRKPSRESAKGVQ